MPPRTPDELVFGSHQDHFHSLHSITQSSHPRDAPAKLCAQCLSGRWRRGCSPGTPTLPRSARMLYRAPSLFPWLSAISLRTRSRIRPYRLRDGQLQLPSAQIEMDRPHLHRTDGRNPIQGQRAQRPLMVETQVRDSPQAETRSPMSGRVSAVAATDQLDCLLFHGRADPLNATNA